MIGPLDQQFLTVGRIQGVRACGWKESYTFALAVRRNGNHRRLHITIATVGAILKNHLPSTLIQNYGRSWSCRRVLLRGVFVEDAHRFTTSRYGCNIVVLLTIDFFVNLGNLQFAFESIFLKGSIGFLGLSKGLWHKKSDDPCPDRDSSGQAATVLFAAESPQNLAQSLARSGLIEYS